jgi:hypothetical protein
VPGKTPTDVPGCVERLVTEVLEGRSQLTQARRAARDPCVYCGEDILQGQNLTLHTLARVAAALRCTPVDLVSSSPVPRGPDT